MIFGTPEKILLWIVGVSIVVFVLGLIVFVAYAIGLIRKIKKLTHAIETEAEVIIADIESVRAKVQFGSTLAKFFLKK